MTPTIKNLKRIPSKRIQKFLRTFDLEASYLFGDAVVKVVNIALTIDMQVVLTVASEDDTCPIVQMHGGSCTFVNVYPDQLQKLQ